MRNWQKLFKRLAVIVKFSFSNLLLPVYSILLSLWVINLCGKNLWGEFVKLFLIVNLASYFLSWGNKDFLLRKFSENPAEILKSWKESLLTRSLLFLIVVPVFLILNFNCGYKILIVGWVIIKFFYLSYDCRIIFRKKFIYSVLAESIGFFFMATVVFFHAMQLTLQVLVSYFLLAEIIKLFIIRILLRENSSNTKWVFNFNYFKSAFPFFILVFSGLVQSRADQFCVNTLLTPSEAAEYQVLMNFLLYATAIPNYILFPYLKNFYRLTNNHFRKLSLYFFSSAILIVPVIIGLIYFAIQVLYHFQLDAMLFLYGALFILPIFFYTPVIYLCFKLNRQTAVVNVVITGIVLNILLCVFLIPAFRLQGALVSAAISQWFMFLIFLFVQKRLINQKTYIYSVVNHNF